MPPRPRPTSTGSSRSGRPGRRAGGGARVVVADSSQTLLCSWLSAVLLGGLVLDAAFGWGWVDPVAGPVIAAIALKEGLDAWRGKGCSGPALPTAAEDACCRSGGA